MGAGVLDNIDRKILFELMGDSRQHVRALAKKIHISPQRAEYRLKELVKSKVILGFITAVDYPRVGLTYAVLNLSLKNITGKKKEQILHALRGQDGVSLVLKGDGYWSVSVGFFSSDLHESRKRLCKIESMFEPYIDYENHFFHVGAHHFPRISFPTLQQTPWDEEEWVSGGGEKYALDDDERRLLSVLSENARASTVDLARKLKITEPSVRRKIRMLREMGVIRGFTLNIDPNLAGHQFVRIYIRRNWRHVPERDPMMEFFRGERSVFRVIHCIGKYDIICDARVEDDEKLRSLVRAIRDRFAGEIVSQEVFRVYDIYRFNFFPAENMK